jgi:Family of unknown function (DUF5719)
VDHEEAGVAVRNRGQFLAALVVVVGVIVSATYLQREIGARPLEAAPPGRVPTGAWFCPHGGGPQDWQVQLELANPGLEPVPVRIRSLGSGKPETPEDLTVAPGSTLAIPADADGRERATTIEYFGGFVAAGWVAHAGGDEGGVAAEPCLAQTGTRWLLPDGSTLEQENDYVVVMNPYPTDAVISLTLLTEKREPIQTEEWTNVALKPFHSMAFRLNEKALGETTVSTIVDVSVGRVAAASLGVSQAGGIRSSVGLLGAPVSQILPAGFDQGRTALAVMNAGTERTSFTADSGRILDAEGAQPIAALGEFAPAEESARTLPLTTSDPSTVVVTSPGVDVAFARRTFGVASDQGSTTGATRAGSAWIVLPAVVGSPAHPGLVLANPGDVSAEVTLSALPAGDRPGPESVTVEVPAGRTVQAPKAFVEAAPFSAVVATATSGTFVPAAASYSLGREGYATYAVAIGVPVPQGWVASLP